jgi:hypothetical protein
VYNLLQKGSYSTAAEEECERTGQAAVLLALDPTVMHVLLPSTGVLQVAGS